MSGYNYGMVGVFHVNHHLPFPKCIGVGFQSNRMQLNTSILHGAIAYLTSTTQLLGNTIPFCKTGCQTLQVNVGNILLCSIGVAVLARGNPESDRQLRLSLGRGHA